MKKQAIYFALTAVCLIANANAEVAKKDFDIAGIKFGMSPGEVSSAMKSFGQGHALGQSATYANNGPDAVAWQEYCLPPAKNEFGGCNGEIRVGYTSNTKSVFYIQRIVDTRGTAKQDEVVSGLTSKYGAKLIKSTENYDFYSDAYVLDASSKKVTPGECAIRVGRELPQFTRANCDLAVYVQVVAQSGQPTLNSRYIVAGTDHTALRASIVAAQSAANNGKEADRRAREGNAKPQKF